MDHDRDYRTGRIEGRLAFKAGAKLHNNPFTIEEARVRGWEDGWQDAADEQAEFDRPKADQTTGLQPGRLTQFFR